MNKKYSVKTAYQNELIAFSFDKDRFYSSLGKFQDKVEKETIKKIIGLIPHCNTIIDVPCGTGRMFELLNNHEKIVIGCDISKEMLTVAINKNFKITTPNLIRCDVEYLPFKNDVLDCIISIRLMGHIPPQNRISITNEFKRITKQWIIISYANSITIGGLFRRIKSFIYHDEWYQINPKSLEQELNDQDLQIKLIEYLQTEIPDKRFHSIITHFQNLLLKYFAETYIVLIEKKNEKV